jgi:hypothetical protein
MRFLHRNVVTSPSVMESHEQAERDLAEQVTKHDNEAPLRNDLKRALEENHLARLVYNALEGRLSGGN